MISKKHHLFILISILMMLLMGTVYTYSVFRYHIENKYQVGTFLSGFPYMLSLFFYALSMMISGRLMKPKFLRKFMFIGTIFIITGWLISGLTNTFAVLVLAYGILIGTGVGMVYGVPIFMIQKMFQKNSGMMAGLVLLGFGMSPLITAPFVRFLIEVTNLNTTFLIFSLIFLVIQLPLTSFFVLESEEVEVINIKIKTSLNVKPFKRIYLLFLIATTIGLMMIGLSYQIGVVNYHFNVSETTLAISLFALMNGISRPLFGRLMDKKGFVYSVSLSVFLMMFAAIIGLINNGGSILLYVVTFALFWFNLGAWLAIIPASIKELYGIKEYTKVYGKMFTAYGVGAIVGTFISGHILDIVGNTRMIYIVILMLLLGSTCLIFNVKQLLLNKAIKKD
jgi:MFS transporter, OFA family, oxalate/formate antiporter